MICNGIDTIQLAALGEIVVSDPATATVTARVRTRWQEGYATRATTEELLCGPERIPRDATLPVDLPQALGWRRPRARARGDDPRRPRILRDAGAAGDVLSGLLIEAVRLSPVADSLTAGVEIAANLRQPSRA